MRRILQVASAMLLGAITSTGVDAQTVSVYYQPTPIPDAVLSANPAMSYHIRDGWFGSVYNKVLVRDDKLQIGGWGDTYASLVRFDLTALPQNVSAAYLYLYAVPSGAVNPSQVSLWPITSTWDPTTVGWNAFPTTATSGFYWPISTAVNTFRSYTITGWYSDWKSGVRPDDGIIIWPYNNDGTQRFDKFVSSHSTSDGQRPLLRLDIVPSLQLKMPLPNNARWNVSTEIGSTDCAGQPDIHHVDSNVITDPDGTTINGSFFAIDFSWRNIDANGNQVYANPADNSSVGIAILAAGYGKVRITGVDDNKGNFVIIDQLDQNGNLTGFSTRYLHLRDLPLVSKGQTVNQGKTLGYMGNTGISIGNHLHFGVAYNNSSISSSPDLSRVVMDGLLLRSYQTDCDASGNRIRYYSSTNVQSQ